MLAFVSLILRLNLPLPDLEVFCLSRSLTEGPLEPPTPNLAGLSSPRSQADSHSWLILPELLSRLLQGSDDLSLTPGWAADLSTPFYSPHPKFRFSSREGLFPEITWSQSCRELVATRGQQHLSISLSGCHCRSRGALLYLLSSSLAHSPSSLRYSCLYLTFSG